MYSSYSSRIRWNEPKLAALRRVKSRITIELKKSIQLQYVDLYTGSRRAVVSHRQKSASSGLPRDNITYIWHKNIQFETDFCNSKWV